MSTYTPGPWSLQADTIVSIPLTALDGEYQSFDVLGESEVGTSEDYANARLIAAAPELAEALHALIEDHAEVMQMAWNGSGGDGKAPIRTAIVMARAALAKAGL